MKKTRSVILVKACGDVGICRLSEEMYVSVDTDFS